MPPPCLMCNLWGQDRKDFLEVYSFSSVLKEMSTERAWLAQKSWLVLWRSSLSCLHHILSTWKNKPKKGTKSWSSLSIVYIFTSIRDGLLLQSIQAKDLPIFFKCHSSVPLFSAMRLHGKQCPAHNKYPALVFKRRWLSVLGGTSFPHVHPYRITSNSLRKIYVLNS